MENLSFVTGNNHKFSEVKAILAEFHVSLVQENMNYPEDKEADISEVALTAARNLSAELQKSVIVDDTGLYFEAYQNFPGPLPKFVFQGIGYEGIFRLLEGKSRKAIFKTIIGYCEPGSVPLLFEGELSGTIAERVFCPEIDAMPYERIFIPEGKNQVMIKMAREEKNSFSHRALAVRKLGNYLKEVA